MDDKNTVVYTDEALKNINDALSNLIVNPYLGCSYKSNNDIKNQIIVLDKGAVEILKAYYKSKVMM